MLCFPRQCVVPTRDERPNSNSQLAILKGSSEMHAVRLRKTTYGTRRVKMETTSGFPAEMYWCICTCSSFLKKGTGFGSYNGFILYCFEYADVKPHPWRADICETCTIGCVYLLRYMKTSATAHLYSQAQLQDLKELPSRIDAIACLCCHLLVCLNRWRKKK